MLSRTMSSGSSRGWGGSPTLRYVSFAHFSFAHLSFAVALAIAVAVALTLARTFLLFAVIQLWTTMERLLIGHMHTNTTISTIATCTQLTNE